MAHIGSNLQRKSDFVNGYQNIEDDRAKSESDEDTPEQGPSRRQSLNEGSPLLSPQREEDNENSFPDGTPPTPLECNQGGDQEESKSAFYLFILTLGIGGLQIVYAVYFSNGSPYLISLGMSKSLLALVWIAGPLSGTIVQPYIGIRSDNCRVSWGKRRPFMLAGAAATAASLLALAWAKEITHGFLGLFGADPGSHGVKVSSMIFATLLVYLLDIAINTVQAGIRAFMVDNAPTHQQEDANAWAGRITGFGNILGFLPGYIDLPKLTGGYFGNQFQILSLIAAFALTSTVIISCLYIHERNPRLDSPSSGTLGVLAFFRQVIKSTRRLPPQIRKVCVVQFFNWIGWFPFLFYITTYVGQIYVNPHFAANPDLTEEQIEKDWEDATRVGTFAYLIFAITSLISSLVLPFLIIPTYRQSTPIESSPLRSSDSLQHHSHPQSNAPGTLHATTSITTSVSRYPIARLLLACQIQWLTLRRAWLLSHILFALCMVSTFFISSVGAATTLVGVIGLPWALSLWAPFALISAEISKRKSEARIAEQRDGTVSANEDKTGINLGLHNVAISAPQIVATLVSSVIFKIAQKPRGSAGDESVAWVLRFGGLSTLIAAYMTYLVDEEGGNMTKTAAEA